MPTFDELRSARLEKLRDLTKTGVNPHPAKVRRDLTIADARQRDGATVAVVGRVMGRRGHGKIAFLDLKDESASVQVVCKADRLSPQDFSLLSYLDIGDFVSVTGEVGKTAAGEVSVFADTYTVASKSLRPLPDQWYGFKDTEDRYRRRYLDLVVNGKVKGVLDARWAIERAIRTFLWGQGYVEVETPILQPLYGGTNAKPFTTHMNALDTDFYLRLAPELYLKRLMVGGYERVFEIARNFRNEGIDLTHQPEFTMMEFYEAYADYQRIMDLTEDLIKYTAEAANKTYRITIGEHEVDLSGTWRRITIDEALKEYAGLDWDTVADEEIDRIMKAEEITVRGTSNRNKRLFAIFEHLVAPKLISPTWVIDYPREVSPLAKTHRSKEGRVERFEGYVGGKEICDGWSEIVCGLEQRERFESEQKNMRAGDEEAHPLDEDFIEALEYGCPPLGGIGIGIDRLVMLLTNTWAIREVIAFPTLRPVNQPVAQKKEADRKPEPKPETPRTHADSGMTPSEAKALLDAHTENINLRRHGYAVGLVMAALAGKLGGDASVWETVGYLHDADWEETKDSPDEHTKKTLAWLAERGMTDGVIVHAIQSHNTKRTNLADVTGPMEWALETCDELTGFIVACALVQPEKKLAAVSVDSVVKKWGKKEFARAVDRSQIEQCEEKLGIPLSEFIGIALSAMQRHADELGL